MKSYYGALTGLRAIAAFMVYLHHNNPGLMLFENVWIEDIGREFHVGVTIFFTLSGFLIATRYLDQATLNGAYVRKYFVNRFARVFPLYFILTSVIYGYYLIENTDIDIFYEYLINISFLRGFSWEYLTRATGFPQSWSLTVEECFYLFALFFFVGLRAGPKIRVATWVLAIVALPATGFLLVDLFQYLELPFFETTKLILSYTFFGRFGEFLIGIGAAILLKKLTYTPRIAWLTYTGVAFFGLGIYFLIRIKYIYDVVLGIHHPLGILVNNLYLPIFISLTIIGLIKEKTLLSTVLKSPLFSLLGRSSYAFYLIHMGYIQALVLPYFDESTYLGATLLFVALSIIAIALYKFIEEPLNKLIRSSQPSLA